MIRRLNSLCALLPLTFMLSACTTDSDESVTPLTDPDAGTGFVAVFKPEVALMPFPNDLWRNGSTDGTLNIQEFESDPLLLHVEQMNLLDGFGLNSPILADFSDPIDPETLTLGETVFVFNATTGAPVTDVTVEVAGFQGGRSVLQINPTEPLAPLTTYAVFLTNGITATDGTEASADTALQTMINAYQGNGVDDIESETLQSIYTAMMETLLTTADAIPVIGAENVVGAWTFTTQSIGASLATIEAGATAQASAFAPIPGTIGAIATAGELLMPDSDLNEDGTPDIGLNADVYAGVIEMPYYSDPENPLTGYWEADAEAPACAGAIAAEAIGEASASTTVYCPTPVVQATIAVPVLITVPNGDAANAACGGNITGVAIFQHGITQSRTNILPVAGTLAQACHATIAIDLPLHGITDTTSGLYASAESPLYAALEGISPGITETLTEQTFNLDLVNNETGEEGADELIDASGEYFINLESPITARDAIRQGAANLVHLVATIPAIDYNIAVDGGATPADFAALPIRLVGHSLGGITGATFLGVNTDTLLDAAVLVAPGGDIGELLVDSESIFPEVEAGLAEKGLTAGMRFFDEFFRNSQTIVDGADPINFAAAANANHNILMMEIVGGAGSLPDQVVPNSATEKLADAMGLPVVRTTIATGNVDGLVQFSAGDHGSILSPAASAEATTEMQTEMAIFIGGHPGVPAAPGGNAIVITETSVIAQ